LKRGRWKAKMRASATLQRYDQKKRGERPEAAFGLCRSSRTLPDMRWVWSVTAIVPATPGVTNGIAASREETMAKLRATWD
jgi:hypothetical protein